jgi:hypothetical protein
MRLSNPCLSPEHQDSLAAFTQRVLNGTVSVDRREGETTNDMDKMTENYHNWGNGVSKLSKWLPMIHNYHFWSWIVTQSTDFIICSY